MNSTRDKDYRRNLRHRGLLTSTVSHLCPSRNENIPIWYMLLNSYEITRGKNCTESISMSNSMSEIVASGKRKTFKWICWYHKFDRIDGLLLFCSSQRLAGLGIPFERILVSRNESSAACRHQVQLWSIKQENEIYEKDIVQAKEK